MGQIKQFGGSLNDYLQSVRDAFNNLFYDAWVQDVFDTYLVCSTHEYDSSTREMYKVNMTPMNDGTFVFATREQWEKVKLSYVQEMVHTSFISELGNNVPNVPIREGIDLEKLTAGDSNPYFLTLQIGEVDKVSQNNLLYDDKLVKSIVEQVNSKPIEGIMGHLKTSEKSTDFRVSDVHWLGAVQEGNMAFAKGYIPVTADKQREHFKILEATGGKAATSIYGWADAEIVDAKTGVWRANSFVLEQLDLAPYTRAALQPTSGHRITAEMNGTIIKPEEIIVMEKEIVVETVNVTEYNALVTEFAELKRINFMREIGEQVKEAININPTSDSGKEAVLALRVLIGETASSICTDAKSLNIYLAKVSETIKPILSALVVSLSGPAVSTVSETKNAKLILDVTPEDRNKALAEMGLSI